MKLTAGPLSDETLAIGYPEVETLTNRDKRNYHILNIENLP